MKENFLKLIKELDCNLQKTVQFFHYKRAYQLLVYLIALLPHRMGPIKLNDLSYIKLFLFMLVYNLKYYVFVFAFIKNLKFVLYHSPFIHIVTLLYFDQSLILLFLLFQPFVLLLYLSLVYKI